MRPSELESLYLAACQTKGYPPNDGQWATWKKALGWCERKDLEAAIAEWWSQKVDFPMPAELLVIAHRIQRTRMAKAGERKFLVLWRCPVCGVNRSGFLAMNDRAVRFCGSSQGPLLPFDTPRVNGQRPQRAYLPPGVTCGAALEIVVDDRLVAA